MSAGAGMPPGADRPRRSVLGDDAESGDPGREPLGLFDSAPPLRAQRPPSAGFHDATGPVATTSFSGQPAERDPARTAAATATAWQLSERGAAAPGNAPFKPITSQLPVLPTPPLERFLETAHRWRTVLGLGLAAIITGGVALAYSGTGEDRSTFELDEAAGGDRSAIAAVTDFSSDETGPASPSTSLGDGDRQVNSAVDDVTTTTTASTTTAAPAESTSTSTTEDTTADSVDTSPTSEQPSTTADGSSTSIDETSTSVDTPTSVTPVPTSIEDTTTTEESTTSTESTVPAGPVRIEAETGTLTGAARVRADHEGYSGTGFVGDLITEGSGVTITVSSPAGGDTNFTIRYAAGPAGRRGPRTLSVLVNGESVSQARMRQTGEWDQWDVIVGTLPLAAGDNTVTLVWADGNDTGWANIDYVEIG